MSEWISVQARMPETDEAVMWWVESEYKSGVFIDIPSVVASEPVGFRKHITHWMPMPESPYAAISYGNHCTNGGE